MLMRSLRLRWLDNKSLYDKSGGLELTGKQILFLSDHLHRVGMFGLNPKIEPLSGKPHADGYLSQTLGIELQLHGLDPSG